MFDAEAVTEFQSAAAASVVQNVAAAAQLAAPVNAAEEFVTGVLAVLDAAAAAVDVAGSRALLIAAVIGSCSVVD